MSDSMSSVVAKPTAVSSLSSMEMSGTSPLTNIYHVETSGKHSAFRTAGPDDVSGKNLLSNGNNNNNG